MTSRPGLQMNEPCDICGNTDTITDTWFNISTCDEHDWSPAKIGQYKKFKSGFHYE
jgi:hypothetical protein